MTEDQMQIILLVEDDRDDYLLTRDFLSEARPGQFKLVHAEDYESALRTLDTVRPDVLLVDFQLGARNGLDLVHAAREKGCRAPAILLTGHSSYALDMEAMRAGVSDYLEKRQLSGPLLERAIRYAIERQQSQVRLEALNNALEMRVEERTRALAESNEQARRAVARLEAQADLTRMLEGAFLDYRKMLEILACRVANMIGDACVITQLSADNQSLVPVAFYHPDPDGTRLMEELFMYHANRLGEGFSGIAAQTGEPVLVPNVPQEGIRERINPALWPYLERFGVHSVLVLPLRIQERFVGTLGVTRDRPGNPYTTEDQVFLEALAGRAALWMANAALYEEAQKELAERRRVEEELNEIQNRLADGAEAERLKLARELHDGPIQDLYGLSLQLRALEPALPGDEEDATMAGLQGSIQRVIDTLRATSMELRPPVLTRFGVAAAIRSHSEQFQKMQPGLEIQLDLADGIGQADLSERVRLAMFRIYQMALVNIVRHAHASLAIIRMWAEAETVSLEIQDNGAGFRVPERWVELARQGHLGLVGAIERAEALGGHMEVNSSPGAGTIIRVTLPRAA